MQTPTHFLLTAFVAHKVQKKHSLTSHWPALHTPALLLGSVLPDIPFVLLNIVYTLYYQWVAPLPVAGVSIMEYLHLTLFFQDPVWIIAHNFFHSLVILAMLLGVGYLAWRWDGWGSRRWGAPLFWLALSALAHTGMDIVTHHSDGPLIFFPLNWAYRFASPFSYWESHAFGYYVIAFEIALDLLILIAFALDRLRLRSSTTSALRIMGDNHLWGRK